MEAVTSTELSLAATPREASLLALRMEARSQQAIADALARQAERQAEQATPPANPDGLGQNVDTYA